MGPWESVRGVAVDYLAGHGVRRCLRKGISRARATVILGAKARGWQLGEAWRDAIASWGWKLLEKIIIMKFINNKIPNVSGFKCSWEVWQKTRLFTGFFLKAMSSIDNLSVNILIMATGIPQSLKKIQRFEIIDWYLLSSRSDLRLKLVSQIAGED